MLDAAPVRAGEELVAARRHGEAVVAHRVAAVNARDVPVSHPAADAQVVDVELAVPSARHDRQPGPPYAPCPRGRSALPLPWPPARRSRGRERECDRSDSLHSATGRQMPAPAVDASKRRRKPSKDADRTSWPSDGHATRDHGFCATAAAAAALVGAHAARRLHHWHHRPPTFHPFSIVVVVVIAVIVEARRRAVPRPDEHLAVEGARRHAHLLVAGEVVREECAEGPRLQGDARDAARVALEAPRLPQPPRGATPRCGRCGRGARPGSGTASRGCCHR